LWALMCYTALLLLEVYQHVPADTGLGSLAKRYLGRYGQWLTGFSKRARHMVFEFQIVGKFRNKMLNLPRDGGTKRRGSAGTLA
ncbi:hypothetical protein MJM99_34950, partial [Salmonella enterica subsp. enterica serovar Kentucky]|nr:hypothetical protein [Salmonella enterica subsp. enterica serovar Kentucky]